MRRSKRNQINTLLIGLILTPTILFPSVNTFAASPSSTPSGLEVSPSPSATAEPSSSPSETGISTPSATPSPTSSGVPGAGIPLDQFSIDSASSLWVVVNKRRPLNPITYRPKAVVPSFYGISGLNPNSLRLAKPAAVALAQMAKALYKETGSSLILASGYRSFSTQTVIHKQKVAQLGLIAGENLAARPGYSEHQTGLAADLSALGQGCSIRVCFANTVAGKWLATNAYEYGFILRYPKGRTAVTGYQFEPWHFRYVGLELSSYMHSQGITILEQVWQLPAAPKY